MPNVCEQEHVEAIVHIRLRSYLVCVHLSVTVNYSIFRAVAFSSSFVINHTLHPFI